MSMWSAIVLIVLIVAVSRVLRARHVGSRRLQRSGNEQQLLPSAREKQLEREVDDLRERIKVLERIATDGNSIDAQETRRIAAEIEALRDGQAS